MLALFAVLIRLPFLLKGEAFFNSDEAIEALMARHLRDWPVFFWGQGYKGVPEVYFTGLVFAVFGVGVVQAKAVTLAIWATAVAMTTRVAQRSHGDATAVVAGLTLSVGSTVLAFWSLSPNAEVAWLTLIASLLLLSRRADLTCLLCGLAMWIHPVAIWLVASVAMAAIARSDQWRSQKWRGIGRVLTGESRPLVVRASLLFIELLVVVAGAIYLYTYAGGAVRGAAITASHPQKVLRFVVVLAGIAVAAHAIAGTFGSRFRALRALLFLLIGIAPVIFYVVRGSIPGAPITTTRLADAPAKIEILTAWAVPMMIGVRDWAGILIRGAGWLTPAFLVSIAIFLVAGRDRLRQFVLVALVVFALLLIPGGVLQDVQSTRYLMPAFGIAAIASAGGLAILWRRSRVVAAALFVMTIVGFSWGQVRWYRQLGLDESDRQVSACLIDHGIREATADYWIAYRLTFLAHEQVLVVPDDALADRYAPYRARVMAAPVRARIVRMEHVPAGVQVLCTSNSLAAIRN